MIAVCSPVGAWAAAANALAEEDNDEIYNDDEFDGELDEDFDYFDEESDNENKVKVIQIKDDYSTRNEDIGLSVCIILLIMSIILFFVFINVMV